METPKSQTKSPSWWKENNQTHLRFVNTRVEGVDLIGAKAVHKVVLLPTGHQQGHLSDAGRLWRQKGWPLTPTRQQGNSRSQLDSYLLSWVFCWPQSPSGPAVCWASAPVSRSPCWAACWPSPGTELLPEPPFLSGGRTGSEPVDGQKRSCCSGLRY